MSTTAHEICEISSDNIEKVNNDVVLQAFIETYEGLPELWNPTDPKYISKSIRNTALDKLLAIYVKSKPGASRADVRRKINTLRSNFSKELKKIENSKRSGTGADEIYSSTSWVFYALQFLNKFEQPANIDLGKQQSQNDEENEDKENENPSALQATPTASRSSINIASAKPLQPITKKSRLSGPVARQNELLQKACAYLENSSKVCEEPKAPIIAKAWGEKLLQLEPQQRVFAEKAINDVLFTLYFK